MYFYFKHCGLDCWLKRKEDGGHLTHCWLKVRLSEAAPTKSIVDMGCTEHDGVPRTMQHAQYNIILYCVCVDGR